MTRFERFVEMANKQLASDLPDIKGNPLRTGQKLYNAIVLFDSKVAHQIHGTYWDCYYDDNKIEEFYKKVEELLNQ
jgi:hypothetical protein